MLGTLKKMTASLDADNRVQYHLPVGDEKLELNSLIGKPFSFSHTGNIYCSNCSKKTKKSYSQGFCYVCMNKLASCDMCIMKPETCHYAAGTCREPQWGDEHCNIPHYVYLSNTSGVKVGITRNTQLPTRWIDQGATQGLTIFKVSTRHLSGLIEVELAKHIADKTHWQAMLKGNNQDLDLKERAAELIEQVQLKIDDIAETHGPENVERLDSEIQSIRYPIEEFPSKIKSYNLDKNPEINDVLIGIKGQYLIFESGVINIRKYGSYEISL